MGPASLSPQSLGKCTGVLLSENQPLNRRNILGQHIRGSLINLVRQMYLEDKAKTASTLIQIFSCEEPFSGHLICETQKVSPLSLKDRKTNITFGVKEGAVCFVWICQWSKH